jgi:hypothetical protein
MRQNSSCGQVAVLQHQLMVQNLDPAIAPTHAAKYFASLLLATQRAVDTVLLASLVGSQDSHHLYKALGAGIRHEAQLLLPVTAADLTDVFHTATLDLSVTVLPEDHIAEQPTPAEQRAAAAAFEQQQPAQTPPHGCKLQVFDGLGSLLKRAAAQLVEIGIIVGRVFDVTRTVFNVVVLRQEFNQSTEK